MSDLTPHIDPQTPSIPNEPSPLEVAGRVANRVAGDHIFERYLSEKSTNTRKRQWRDLALFKEYLEDCGVPLPENCDFQHDPHSWRGVTWGLVEGFVQWQLQKGYAIASVNSRLSSVRSYSQLAVKAGAIERTEGILIQSVKGYSRQGGLNVDEQREQTRKRTATYVYQAKNRDKPIEITRRSTKKSKATLLTKEQANELKTVRNKSEQAWRDALMMCLFLDHGLRSSEVAILKVDAINLESREMRFYRPKVKGTDHEWTTHKLTESTYEVAKHYIENIYPADLKPDGPLILGTTRLLKNGTGGFLMGSGMIRERLTERVAFLGRQLYLEHKLSAHDCRHTCATQMARLGYQVDELMAWFGWTSAGTAMRYVASADVKVRYKG